MSEGQSTGQENVWPAPEIRHLGTGRADFSDPKGWVRGPAEVHVDEQGRFRIEMRVTEYESEEPSDDEHNDLFILLTGGRPRQVDGQLVLQGSDFSRNTLSKFEIETDDGTVKTGGTLTYDTVDLGAVFSLESDQPRLAVTALWAQFDVATEACAKYWALPLSNFLSYFNRQAPDDLQDHPLRIHNVTGSGSVAPDNQLIKFKFNGRPGFVEPVANYSEREKELLAGKTDNRITALMAGEVGRGRYNNIEALEGWFPFFFFEVLGLATGSEVGAPWIELRDAQKELVCRIYARRFTPRYTRGQRAIDESLHRSTGDLLTHAGVSPGADELRKSYLRVCIRQAMRAKLKNTPLEEQLAHVFRAVDSLCEQFELKKGPRLKDVVREDARAKLNGIIKASRKEMRDLASAAETDGEHDEAAVLNKISDQVSNAKGLTVGFGRAFVALLEKFGHPDARIVSSYYTVHPRPDGRDWPAVLSMYRGATLHTNYLGITREDKTKMWDAVVLVDHLHDVVLRVVLKLIGYCGDYQPTVQKMEDKKPTDWVDSNTGAGDLGYGRYG